MEASAVHDPDAPSLRIAGPQPAAGWLAAAAARLGLAVAQDDAVPVCAVEHATLEGEVLAVHGVRSPHGQAVVYAIVLEQYLDGALDETSAAADVLPAPAAVGLQQAVVSYLREHDVVGACCMRFRHGAVTPVVVTLGPDATSGWTEFGCVTPVAENHLRAVLDLPLGSPALVGRYVSTAAVRWAPGLFAAFRHCMARDPALRLDLTAMRQRPGMTIGLVGVVSEDADDARRRVRHAADYLNGTIEE